MYITVYPSHRNAPHQEKLPIHSLISLVVPAVTLLSCLIAFRVSDANGWEAVFPSIQTCPIVLKLTTFMTLIAVVLYEQSFYHYSSGGKNLFVEGRGNYVGLEVVVDDGMVAPSLDNADCYEVEDRHEDFENVVMEDPSREMMAENANEEKDSHRDRGGIVIPAHVHEEENKVAEGVGNESSTSGEKGSGSLVTPSVAKIETATSPTAAKNGGAQGTSAATPTNGTLRGSTNTTQTKAIPDPSGANSRGTSIVTVSTPRSSTSTSTTPTATTKPPTTPPAKSAPGSIPFRFIRATKGDVAAAKVRWAATCKWRTENSMDTCLIEPHPNVKLIKENYPHYFHLRGIKNECCYYERPAKMNIPELKKNGISMEKLLKHYSICCDYMWNKIDDSEEAKSIYVIDLDGIGFRDFAGEVVDFVKKASTFTGDHYPERSGSIFIINVPSWFSVIWNVVKPMVDDVTKAKIKILRYGTEGITKALTEKIAIENIPPEYGGKSMPLGQSPEELGFMKHFEALNQQN